MLYFYKFLSRVVVLPLGFKIYKFTFPMVFAVFHGFGAGSPGRLFCFIFIVLNYGQALGKDASPCSRADRCSFGNEQFCEAVIKFSENIPIGGCSTPIADFAAKTELSSDTSDEVRQAVDRIVDVCGEGKKRPAQCTLAFMSTAEDLILHVVASLSSVFRVHYLRGEVESWV